MQRKLNWVLWLIIVFLVLIDLLQLTWLYFNYREQDTQYKRLLTSSLGDAVMMYQQRTVPRYAGKKPVFYIISGDSTARVIQQGDNKITFSGNGILDSVTNGLGYNNLLQMRNKDKLDLPLLDSIFRSVLESNEVSADYILDTLPELREEKVKNQKESVKTKPGKLVATKANYPEVNKEYPVRTAAMMVNNFGNKFVFASFKSNPGYVFKKLAWILLGSLVLFIVTNLALIFVLRTIRKQKKIDEIKNDFISNMTHELRTPITVATTAIDSILNHHGFNDETKAREYLQSSREELLHLDQLVEKILNLAMADKTEFDLNYEAIDLQKLLNAIIENYRMVSSKELFIKLDTEPGIKLSADRIHLANAMSNLVDNAIKYSHDPVHINIHCWQQERYTFIEVSDKGIGIPKPYIHEIFKAFFRVPHKDLHDVKGFGLGLSYVKKVAEAHGGSVKVESSNDGTTFTFIIPKEKPNGR